MRPDKWLVLLALAAGPAMAEIDENLLDKDVPPAPAFNLRALIPLEVAGSGLRFGIDPDTVTVGKDSVIRYVVVATGMGSAVNAMYEGLRCDTAQYRVYARHSGSGNWQVNSDANWHTLYDDRGARHSLAFARAGACMGRAPAGAPSHIMRDLDRPDVQRLR